MSLCSRFRVPVAAALSLLLGLAGCNDGTGPGPASSAGARFSRDITFEEFQGRVLSGEPLRVEIEITDLTSGPPYLAREVEIGEPDDLADREEVKSRVVGIDLTGACEGTLRLELEGVQIGFSDASTEFQRDDLGTLSCAEFRDFIQAELAANRNPEIEAKRQPSFDAGVAVPQDPTDALFAADRIELEDDDADAEIELNIDGDNLLDCSAVSNAPADCLGALQVLSAVVVIGPATELESDIEDGDETTEFEGLVESVAIDPNDPDLGTVTLQNGQVIRIAQGTEIKQSGDEDRLRSLQEVQDALTAGFSVEADGKGVVDSADPSVIVAHQVEFEIEDNEDDDAGTIGP